MAAAEAPPNFGQAPPDVLNLDPKSVAVRAELDRILSSPQFRGTKRSQEFLRFIVERKLEGKTETLKERSIGVQIFGRSPDYDTGEDSIVRVKANEVRKRLAQYHMEAGPAPAVEIELPSGSYVPEFRWVAAPEEPAPVPEPAPPPPPAEIPLQSKRPVWLIPGLAAVVVLGVALGWYALSRHTSPVERFWQPVLSSGRPVLICVAHPSVHHITGATRQAILRGESPASVPMTDIVQDPDHYVGIGDALAVAQLSALFSRLGKGSHVRIGNDMSFADLRNSPSVLVGGLTNQWTAQTQNGMRFVFERGEGTVVIRDQKVPGRRWVWQATPPLSDYAIISRVFDSRSGQPMVTAAGLSHTGTQIAGEFLTSQQYLKTALGDLKPGWERQNLQILLRAEVVGKTPGPPKVLETHVWPR